MIFDESCEPGKRTSSRRSSSRLEIIDVKGEGGVQLSEKTTCLGAYLFAFIPVWFGLDVILPFTNM